MIVVIDASVAVSWCVASQSTAASNLLLNSANAQFVAPHVFSVEVRNALLKAERNRRVQPRVVDEAIQFIVGQLVTCEPTSDEAHLQVVFELARSEQLSFFDALYLECASRRAVTIATRDEPLLRAATRRNLSIYDAR